MDGSPPPPDRETHVSFAGCDSLGLRDDPRVVEAARAALARDGLGAGASRATTGEHRFHRELETALADFVGLPAALLLPSGVLANLALGAACLRATSGPATPVFLDPRSHASLGEAIALAGAQVVDDPREARVVCTDGVFPSRGEIADLRALLTALPPDGTLVVDDCHGLGVVGPGGRGSLHHHGIDDPRVVVTATLSKALGGAGGVVLGPRTVIERVAQHPLHVGSTALPPAWAAAGLAALGILRDEPERHAALLRAIADARELLPPAGVPLPPEALPVFRIDAPDARTLSAISVGLAADGFLVPHIRYPDGPEHGYLRAAVRATHTRAGIAGLAEALSRRLAGRDGGSR